MKACLQRVSRAEASERSAYNKQITSIGKGLLIFAGFSPGDTFVLIEQLAQKIKNLRIFSDDSGKMNLTGTEIGAEYLLVSQFTLFADCKYGNRPSFAGAAEKEKAKQLYQHFVHTAERLLGPQIVRHTAFGTDLEIELVNDGPVTLWLDSKEIF